MKLPPGLRLLVGVADMGVVTGGGDRKWAESLLSFNIPRGAVGDESNVLILTQNE